MDRLLIRQAEPEDAAVMAEIDRLCFKDPWSLDAFEAETTTNQVAFYVVADIGRRTVGYAGLWWLDFEGHITNVAVHPDFRGLGVAKAMLKAMLDFTGEEGITDYTLEVRESNEAALCLYESFGFSQEGRRPGYYKDEDAIIMWRRNGKSRS